MIHSINSSHMAINGLLDRGSGKVKIGNQDFTTKQVAVLI